MNSKSVKIIIIEDDKKQVDLITSVLPDYYTVKNIKYSDAAIELAPEPGFTTVVVMNADDKAGRSLQTYKYMSEDTEFTGISYIPVVLFTDDQYSDNAFSFYDYGDPFFHEGEIDDIEFFSVVNEAVENAEEIEYEQLLKAKEAAKKATEDKEQDHEVVINAISADKLMGKSYEISTDEAEILRIVAYNNPEVLKAINQATGDTAEKAKIVKAVIEEITSEDEAKGHSKVSGIIYEEKKKEIPSIHKINDPTKVGILLSDDEDEFIGSSNGKPSGILKKFDDTAKSKADDVRNVIRQKLNAAKGAGKVTDTSDNDKTDKKTKILIVDSDPMTVKACKLFLGDVYEIVSAESNMKANDFFIKDTADIVLIEQNMPYMKGTMILKSLMMQPNAKNIRAAIFVDSKMPAVDKEEILYTIGVRTIIEKPIVKKQLIQAINRCMAAQF